MAAAGLPRAVERVRAYLEHVNRHVLRPVTLSVRLYSVPGRRCCCWLPGGAAYPDWLYYNDLLIWAKLRKAEPTQFCDLPDRTLALRGFDIEYTEFGADAEAVLGTGRPLREAVAMLSAMKGVEVASVSWSDEGGWRFGVRRIRSFMMLESEFDALRQAGAAGAAADRTTGRSG